MILVGSLFILAGSVVIALATFGIFKFQDVFLRMHAASKSASFAVVLMLIGAMFFFPQLSVIAKLMFATFLLFLKTPVASQAIARAAYFLREPEDWENLVVDEWHGKSIRKKKRKPQKAT
jgi:multicomponent Na+:H+ antiporter subunit G